MGTNFVKNEKTVLSYYIRGTDMKNIIYAYKKVIDDKIVYVGQTINMIQRRQKHEKYDPYNPNTKEYNYPLSRGIRKNGIDAYQFIILETVEKQEDLDNRERY